MTTNRTTVPPIPPDAILDARIVGLIQAALVADLPWLDNAYGIAEACEMKMESGGIGRFPRVYSNLAGNNYYDVRYDDSIKSQVFFERDGELIIGENDEFDQTTYALSLVFWGNLNSIDAGRNYDYKGKLAGAIVKCLRDNFLPNISDRLDIELRSNEAYSKYTMRDVDNRFLTFPYTAFRISFTWTEFNSGDCFDFIPIGGNPC